VHDAPYSQQYHVFKVFIYISSSLFIYKFVNILLPYIIIYQDMMIYQLSTVLRIFIYLFIYYLRTNEGIYKDLIILKLYTSFVHIFYLYILIIFNIKIMINYNYYILLLLVASILGYIDIII
jgi:hypothetical protein